MSDSGNGGGGEPWPLTVILSVCSGVIVTVTMTQVYAVPWLGTLITATVTVMCVMLLGWLAFRLLKSMDDRVRAPLLTALTSLVWGAAGAALMAVVLLAGATSVRFLEEHTGACGLPLELRVLTAPETLTPLRAAAAEFETAAEDGGCREYSVTVVPEEGPLPLYDGFRLLWRRSASEGGPRADGERLFGPQPDVWIPASTAEYEFIPKGPGQVGQAGRAGATGAADGGPAFRSLGSLGSSPLVLALFSGAHESVHDPLAPPMAPSAAELLERFEAARVPLRGIARPVPETSSAALAVTPALYDAMPGGDAQNERVTAPAGLAAPDAVSLLCRFRERAAAQDSEPPDDMAVAVPEQVLYDYDMGRPLGDRCGGTGGHGGPGGAGPDAKWRLYPYYATDLPTLDYPFIQVKWGGQDTEARDAGVTGFHRWLGDNPLTLQGFRDTRGTVPPAREGDTEHHPLARLHDVVGGRVMPAAVALTRPEGVQATLDRVGAARPRVSVSLMLDVSGSMGGAARAHGGSRLSRGASFLRSLVTQLQGNDRAGLQVSSSTASPGDSGTVGNVPQGAASPGQKNAVTNGLEAVASTGADRPLADTVEAADLGPGRPNLILVTDGQGPDTNPRLGARAAWLSGEFRDQHPDLRVTVVLTGPATCGSTPVEEVVDALGPGDGGSGCVELTDAPEAEQAAELLSGLR
ncbi:VWA domain-containing protein [Actinomadura sp. 7K507]|uniref:VWA domain-containing protein n=1 Tax=Actinomadura sp. 7K507 TaxID=2530365 RepID=UPI0014044497|nr:VWA domain-containing protein [Actinomadura sp. 7K507]